MLTPSLQTFLTRHQDPHCVRRAVGTIFLLVLVITPAVLLVVVRRLENSRGLRVGDTIPAANAGKNSPVDSLIEGLGKTGCALFFFGAECPHCQRQVPAINEAEKQFLGRVNIIAVTRNSEDQIRAFVAKYGLTARVITDDTGWAGNFFGVYELPTLILVGRDRRIEWIGTGERPKEEILRRLTVLANQKAF
jgi:peroxiredoxin